MAGLERLGKYEIRRELGRGAMGIVYEAFDPLIKRSVALKTIRTDQLEGEQGQDVIARFRHEAQAAGRLAHPNIVAIYDFGEEGGVWYIAMEFLKGRELKDYFLTSERFATADIVRIMTQILAALGYAHRQGVVHRDIKPANVVVIEDGTVKVADFGIAHIETSNMTQAGAVLGTPAYMSPEQILGLPVDGRSDLFSAGVILYQFLTGERPFSGSSTATMHKVLEEEPLPPSRFNVQVPGSMDAVVRKALAKRPEDRYQSADEFAAAIGAAMAAPRAAADATAVSPAAVASAEATVVAPATVARNATATKGHAPATPPPGRKAPVALIAIGGGLAVVAIVAGVWLTQQRSGGDAPKVAQAPAAVTGATAPGAGSVPPPAASPPASLPAAPPAAAAPSPPSATPKTAPGLLTISAVGLVDPKDPRYGNDKALLQTDLRADSKSQLVEKALGLMLEPGSLAKNYDVLRDKLLAQSGSFITTTVRESEPRTGKDGLVSMTTEAVVDVKALQKSLNLMSREQRIEFIRAGGDPRISVAITVRDADAAGAAPQPSPVAENLLKERIKSFGFRTWSDDAAAAGQRADFAVQGEAQIKKLSMRLEASGVVITKYALTSWTVKCVDRDTGEEIYFNTTLPKGVGSWASEGEALKAIGTKIADEFSRDFFLQHLNVTGRKVTITIAGLPGGTAAAEIGRELLGLPAVINATPMSRQEPHVYELQLGGSGNAGDLVVNGILKPLNAQLGQPCLALGSVSGDQVAVTFDQQLCGDAAVLSRLETNPPAGLYGAPPGRQKAVIRDPETLRRLTI